MRDNGINKQKQRESHLKSELKKEKNVLSSGLR